MGGGGGVLLFGKSCVNCISQKCYNGNRVVIYLFCTSAQSDEIRKKDNSSVSMGSTLCFSLTMTEIRTSAERQEPCVGGI